MDWSCLFLDHLKLVESLTFFCIPNEINIYLIDITSGKKYNIPSHQALCKGSNFGLSPLLLLTQPFPNCAKIQVISEQKSIWLFSLPFHRKPRSRYKSSHGEYIADHHTISRQQRNSTNRSYGIVEHYLLLLYGIVVGLP